jgi:cadmium resistance protein CadD (predicted permease)
MGEILTILAIASGAFIGTNLDNLVLLVALHSRYEKHSGIVTIGYFTGMILIAVISFAIGKVGAFIPIAWLGMLGVIPMMIGVFALWQLVQNKQAGDAASDVSNRGGQTIFFAVLATQLSNGADSIITFSIFFADSSDSADYLIVLAFLAMVCVFAWLALYLLKHRKLGRILSRYGQYVTPFILILVGFYILSNTASDLMPG